jgi:RHS repeat-associated protein
MDSGVTLESGETISWEEPGELSYQRTTREEYFDNEEERRQAIVTEVMTKLVDWNGDGRLDVLDAKGPDDFHWTLWQNNPGPGGMPSWTKVLISNGELREHIIRHNLGLHPYASGWVALERSRSWQQYWSGTCQSGCSGMDDDRARTDTVGEWSLEDANGDGFVDIIASTNRVRECENQCLNAECGEFGDDGQPLPCVLLHTEWLSDETCGPGPSCEEAAPGDEQLPQNSAVVYLNRRGAIPTVVDRSYEPARSGKTSAWSTGAVRDLVAADWHAVDPGVTFHVEGYLRDPVGRPRPVRDHLDGLESYESTRHEVCGVGGGGGGTQPFESRQRDGLADINGDGRPDHVWNDDGQWYVEFGTSAGYAVARHPIAHVDDGAGFPFELSASKGVCTGSTNAVAGLLDVDGDGKPELVRVFNGVLMAASILPFESADSLDAGRLIAVENGFGARTDIRYANNKAERYTSHQVAMPEIVVAQTQTTITDGSAPNGAPTRYAYGDADSRYDFVSGRVTFTGYRKQVTASGEVKPNGWWVRGAATLVERAPPAASYTTYAALVTGGRPVATNRYEGVLPIDARELLAPGAYADRITGGTALTYGVVEFPEGPIDVTSVLECVDVDVASGAPNLVGICTHAGIVYTASTATWEGAAETGTNNVKTASSVKEVDERGRPVEIVDYGDTRTVADDRCITIQYATPTLAGDRAISAVTGTWVSDCGWKRSPADPKKWTEGAASYIAGQRFTYDDLPEGQVGRGRLTSHVVERYDTTTGEDLGEAVVETRSYDALGNIKQTRSSRGAVTRTTSFTYDAFGMTVRDVSLSASDVAQPPLVTSIKTPLWPNYSIETTYPNGERTTVDRDTWGRPTLTWRNLASSSYLVESVDYNDSFTGRTLERVQYPLEDRPQRSFEQFDALGRRRFVQRQLGNDYDGMTLVSGFVEYDALGRPVYQAAPFEWPEYPFEPQGLPADPPSWPRGLTLRYNDRGRLAQVTAADGKRVDVLLSDASSGIYVTLVENSWRDGRAVTTVRGPLHTAVESGSFWGWRETQRTALGSTLEEAEYAPNETRLDLARHDYDRFANEVLVSRYSNAQSATDELVWQRRFDSAGAQLQIREPGNAIRYNTYDEWGELVLSSWSEGGIDHAAIFNYDGLGRIVSRRLANGSWQDGYENTEDVTTYLYDVHAGASEQPSSPLRGRLSRITGNLGSIYFDYDSLGGVAGESHVLTDYGSPVRIEHTRTPGGVETDLRYVTSAGVDRITYGYDSAGRVKSVSDETTGSLFDAQQIDPKGRYRTVLYGNGVLETASFAPTGRQALESWWLTTASGGWGTAFPVRDATGRVLQEQSTQLSTQFENIYKYDQLGQLIGASSWNTQPALSFGDQYAYDGLGNIKKRVAQSSSAAQLYSYDPVDRDRACRVATTTGSCNILYDGLGNVVWDTTAGSTLPRALEYDSASRITTAARGPFTASFAYGPAGDLARTDVFKQGIVIHRVWSFGGLIEARRRPDGGSYIERRVPGPLGIIASLRNDDETRETVYIHGDHRGNQVFTDSSGQVVQQARYRAFGALQFGTASSSSITSSDDLRNGGDNLGQLGIVVLGARIYDPSIGRFLQRDPLAFSDTSAHGSPYAFAFNDPINSSDPSGMEPTCLGKECSGVVVWSFYVPMPPYSPSSGTMANAPPTSNGGTLEDFGAFMAIWNRNPIFNDFGGFLGQTWGTQGAVPEADSFLAGVADAGIQTATDAGETVWGVGEFAGCRFGKDPRQCYREQIWGAYQWIDGTLSGPGDLANAVVTNPSAGVAGDGSEQPRQSLESRWFPGWDGCTVDPDGWSRHRKRRSCGRGRSVRRTRRSCCGRRCADTSSHAAVGIGIHFSGRRWRTRGNARGARAHPHVLWQRGGNCARRGRSLVS